jgi:drug/metabolite transporter (DMT)-like permease
MELLGRMNLKKCLKNQIHGWLPKETNPPNNKVKVTEAPTTAVKVLWYVVVLAILALIVVAVIMFYIPFLTESLVNRTIALVLFAPVAFAFYRAYGRDYYKSRPKESRAVFVACSGLASGFMISGLAVAFLGHPLPFPYSLLLFFAIVGVGAFVGDKAGRKLGLY